VPRKLGDRALGEGAVTGNHVQEEWRALHERIDACTAQLVDHYQRDPAQIVR
jgi:hypothetical protein